MTTIHENIQTQINFNNHEFIKCFIPIQINLNIINKALCKENCLMKISQLSDDLYINYDHNKKIIEIGGYNELIINKAYKLITEWIEYILFIDNIQSF